MRKKIFYGINLVLIFIIAACEKPLVDDDPVIIDDRLLVTEECEHLDNIDDWQPVWCDEFDVDGLPDSDKWSYDIGGSGWGNNESQYYTSEDLDNSFIEDGILSIKAIKETYEGSDYTSARLVSKYQGDWTYGRIQISARLPEGNGLWAALWMLPTDFEYGGWPYSGEIDIMEYVGYDLNRVHTTLHSGAYNHTLGTQIGYSKIISDAETEFHLYEMIWEPGKIDMFMDGILVGSFGFEPDDNIDIDNNDAWPFDKRFHLIMNLAVGGNWGGAQGIDDSVFPQAMEVDYVRVYQKDYESFDNEDPSVVSNIYLQKANTNSLKVMWDEALDDIMIKEYLIYVDDVFVGVTSLNAYLIENLDPVTSYKISVFSVDFADNVSAEVSNTFVTSDYTNIDGIIEAEDYDAQEGIKLQETSDIGGGQNVGWTDQGDYLTYILEVEESGDYVVDYRVSGFSADGSIKLLREDIELSLTNIISTGGWQVWETVTSSEFTLEEGVYTFKILIINGNFNINYFTFKKVD